MRKGFESTLHRYRDNIVDQNEADTDAQIARFNVAADVEIERRANAVGISKEVEAKIFSIQEEKQRIMRDLKSIMKVIDGKEAREFAPSSEDRVVSYNSAREVYRIGEGDSQEDASLGEVVHDGDFGIAYAVDFADANIPRQARKKFAVEDAKRKIQKLLDLQIISEEVARLEKNGVRGRQRSYESFLDVETEKRSGKLAEQVIGYMLHRLETDGKVPFGLEVADVFEDVEHKIDFIFRRKDHQRDVQTEVSEVSSIGLQYTMRTDKEGVEHKQRQIDNVKKAKDLSVNDIVLVSIPIADIQSVYYQWRRRLEETGKTAGGPLAFLPAEEKEFLVRGLFKDFLTDREMDELLISVSDVHNRDEKRVRDYEDRERIAVIEEGKHGKLTLDEINMVVAGELIKVKELIGRGGDNSELAERQKKLDLFMTFSNSKKKKLYKRLLKEMF